MVVNVSAIGDDFLLSPLQELSNMLRSLFSLTITVRGIFCSIILLRLELDLTSRGDSHASQTTLLMRQVSFAHNVSAYLSLLQDDRCLYSFCNYSKSPQFLKRVFFSYRIAPYARSKTLFISCS